MDVFIHGSLFRGQWQADIEWLLEMLDGEEEVPVDRGGIPSGNSNVAPRIDEALDMLAPIIDHTLWYINHILAIIYHRVYIIIYIYMDLMENNCV